jgi:isopentenyl-diphosphate delta-isomerase
MERVLGGIGGCMGNTELLEEYDSIQAEMMAESCIMVDSSDTILGAVSKYSAHRDQGVLHRAFSVLMFNDENKLLIQRRSDQKITFPGVWANSCCSHPLSVEGENTTGDAHGVGNAAIRKLSQELGIDTKSFVSEDFNLIGRFEYSSKAEQGWIEHELDYVIGIHSNVLLNPNINEISDYKWLSKEELFDFCSDESNIIAPWFIAIIKLYLTNWWPKNSNDYPKYDLLIPDMGELS